MNREDCDDDNVYKSMCLLKRITNAQIDELKDMNEIEFRKVVQQAKRRSTSSMFSKRDYSVCEFAIKVTEWLKCLLNFITQ